MEIKEGQRLVLDRRVLLARKRLNEVGLHTTEQIVGAYKVLYGAHYGLYIHIDHLLNGRAANHDVTDRLEDMADQMEAKGAALSDFNNFEKRMDEDSPGPNEGDPA